MISLNFVLHEMQVSNYAGSAVSHDTTLIGKLLVKLTILQFISLGILILAVCTDRLGSREHN